MSKVESQLIRADVGARLADMFPQKFPQRRVQQVGRGVVRGDAPAARGVHLGQDSAAGGEFRPSARRTTWMIAEPCFCASTTSARTVFPSGPKMAPWSPTWLASVTKGQRG